MSMFAGITLFALAPVLLSLLCTAAVKLSRGKHQPPAPGGYVVRAPQYMVVLAPLLAMLCGGGIYGLGVLFFSMLAQGDAVLALVVMLPGLLALLALCGYSAFALHSALCAKLYVYPSHMVYCPEFRRPFVLQYGEIRARQKLPAQGVTSLRLYKGTKRVFRVDAFSAGFPQLVQTLRQKNVPFTINGAPSA